MPKGKTKIRAKRARAACGFEEAMEDEEESTSDWDRYSDEDSDSDA